MAEHLGGVVADAYDRAFPLAPPEQRENAKVRLGPPPVRRPGVFRRAFVAIFFGIVPLCVAYLAAFVAYINTTPIPMGTLFWMMGQPGLLFANKTVGVPDDLKAGPRPPNELFLDLPGGSKMPMSGLGMCCRPTAYHDESVRRSVFWYLLQGGRHIDTAAVYLNHKAVGLGIKDAMARGIPRSEIFVTTKIWTSHFNETLASEWVNDMLQELGLEYVDLVLMHMPRRNAGIWPGLLPRWNKMLPFYDEEVKGLVWIGGLAAIWPNDEDEDFKDLGCETIKQCRQQTWKSLSNAREKGLIKEIGVSNFRVQHLQELEQMKLAPIAVNQIAYHPWISEVAFVKSQPAEFSELGHARIRPRQDTHTSRCTSHTD